MDITTSVLKSPSNKLPRWMVATVPNVKSTSAFILKGTYPAYLFEIMPPRDDENCIKVEYKKKTYCVAVKLDIDEAGEPPHSYLVEMLGWYASQKVKPYLSKILSSSEED
ncbi:hypothetical protein [Persicitalea jodogahamensis]|uniref:Uncharacterized protein n=1 Tax=Persicitalea jodogahamensis TaxID=402147 RepID=A0A8J3D3E5_9BACT|nr:hypothetical protein [Persicitalea jodogahamensis]GHB76117.1 hypothetical protein GCM10007390_32490 [Persicitalea jodogahamensis]